MATINMEEEKCKSFMLTKGKRLLDAIFDLMDEFDIEEWKDSRYLKLADIWCEIIEDNKEWLSADGIDRDDFIKKRFYKAIIERMIYDERQR